jgi:hypothetical protein
MGVTCMANIHAVADNTSWKMVQHALTSYVQTLDVFLASEQLKQCAERIYGEDSEETNAADKRSHSLLVRLG